MKGQFKPVRPQASSSRKSTREESSTVADRKVNALLHTLRCVEMTLCVLLTDSYACSIIEASSLDTHRM